jgi:hypothetical protein
MNVAPGDVPQPAAAAPPSQPHSPALTAAASIDLTQPPSSAADAASDVPEPASAVEASRAHAVAASGALDVAPVPLASATITVQGPERPAEPIAASPSAEALQAIDDIPSSELTPLDDDELSVELDLGSRPPPANRTRRSTPPPPPAAAINNGRRPGAAPTSPPTPTLRGTPSGPPPLPTAANGGTSESTPRRSLPPPVPPRKG